MLVAQPDQEHPQDGSFRVTARTYGASTEPLVEVLLMLHDWSVERARRQPPTPATDTIRNFLPTSE